jgi:hypothetical protein
MTLARLPPAVPSVRATSQRANAADRTALIQEWVERGLPFGEPELLELKRRLFAGVALSGSL